MSSDIPPKSTSGPELPAGMSLPGTLLERMGIEITAADRRVCTARLTCNLIPQPPAGS